MPRILQIDSCLGVGSTGRITESIGALAMAKGWECYIAHGARYVGESKMKSIPVVTKLGEYAHALKSRLFDLHGLGSTRETKQLVKKIKQIKPDIVHLHCIHGYYLNYKVLFEYLNTTNIPVIWTFHDFWGITGHCAHFVEAKCDKWQSGCYECPLINRYPASLTDSSKKNYKIKKLYFSGCNNLNIVAVSDWLKECVAQSFLSDKPIRVIPNGIDLSVYRSQNAAAHIPNSKQFIMLGVASQWKEGKGFEDYMKLSKYLKDDEVIVLVGLSKQQISQLPSNIIGYECLSSQVELSKLYSSADVLLSLSYAETFGMTIVEAAACGTPAIVYDNTAQKSMVTADTGFVVQTGNVDEVYKAVEKIRQVGKKNYSYNCRERVEKYFDKNKSFMNYISLYEELLKGNN